MDFFYCDNYNIGAKFQPIVGEYIQSEFINNVGLGVVVFALTLFITILVGKL